MNTIIIIVIITERVINRQTVCLNVALVVPLFLCLLVVEVYTVPAWTNLLVKTFVDDLSSKPNTTLA